MEKLKSLRKQRGYTQEYMSKIPPPPHESFRGILLIITNLS